MLQISFVFPSYMMLQKYIENRNKIIVEKEKAKEDRSKLEEKKGVKYKRAAKRSSKIVEESCGVKKGKKDKEKVIGEVEDAKVNNMPFYVVCICDICSHGWCSLAILMIVFLFCIRMRKRKEKAGKGLERNMPS